MGLKRWSVILISHHYLELWSRICDRYPVYCPLSPWRGTLSWNFMFTHYLKVAFIHILCENKVILILNYTGVTVPVADTDQHCTNIYSDFLTTHLILIMFDMINVNGSFSD
jgi:hypothetical protein